MTEPLKPVLIYDGDCGFCRRWIVRWSGATGDRVDYAPYQSVAGEYPQIPLEAFVRAVQLVQPDGTITSGAEAVFLALAEVPRRRWPLWMYRHVPGVRCLCEVSYGLVARNRRLLSFLTSVLIGPPRGPSTYFISRRWFIRLMGVIYIIAFASLSTQIIGLCGSTGILPTAPYLEAIHERLGATSYLQLPSLTWFGASDQALWWLCFSGIPLGLLVLLGIAPGLGLFFLWALYLSLCSTCRVFLSFQWDVLLLEAGFLAIFFAPWKLRSRAATDAHPPKLALLLIWWLLFRLIFSSGVVKLWQDNPRDPTWHNLTALNYHYETQPLPTWTAWYAHQLPEWFQKLSVGLMFVIEIGVPFLVFMPRRLRIAAFFPLVFLQVLIAATGNYNFFNLLTIALCLTLLDDNFWRTLVKRFRRQPKFVKPTEAIPVSSSSYKWIDPFPAEQPRLGRAAYSRVPLVQQLSAIAVAVPILIVSGVYLSELRERPAPRDEAPSFPVQLRNWTFPFRSINTYGLFRHMTTHRPEIIIEGSNDLQSWLEYEFPWKPGDLSRRPRFVAPHQPRLDWQMWFAALGNRQANPYRWFDQFLQRLLEGSQPVLALLKKNPFPDSPPRYIRAVLYDYHFADWKTRRETGHWWQREKLGLYAPPVSLPSSSERR